MDAKPKTIPEDAKTLLELLRSRRSIRRYTDEHITDEELQMILQAGLLAPSGRNLRPVRFVVVRDRAQLDTIAKMRKGGTQPLLGADCAIIVLGDETQSDTIIEDCSIAMSNMMLMAHALGIGACWIQGRLRGDSDGISMDDSLRELFGWGSTLRLEATLALGRPAESKAPYELETLDFSKVSTL